MENFVTESQVLKMIEQALSLSKSKKTSKGANPSADVEAGTEGSSSSSSASSSTPEVRPPVKKMSYDDFFKESDEVDLMTRVFRAQVPTPAELYLNGLVGVSDADLATYFTYAVRSLVMCGFVHSYSAWMYMLIMNARKDTMFGHRNLEIHQLKNLVTLLAVPLVDGSGRKSMLERVTSTLAQRTTYDLVCELSVRVGNGEVLSYTGPPITTPDVQKKSVRKADDGEVSPPPAKKKSKSSPTTPKATTKKAKLVEPEADEADEADDVFGLASPNRRSGRTRTPNKSFFANEFVGEDAVGAMVEAEVDEAEVEAEVDEAEVEAEVDEAEVEAEVDEAPTQVQMMTQHQIPVVPPQLEFLMAATPLETPMQGMDVETVDPIEFTPVVSDIAFEKITIPMVPRVVATGPLLTASPSTNLVKRLVIKRPGAPTLSTVPVPVSTADVSVAPAGPAGPTGPTGPAVVDIVRMNPDGTGYHSDGVFFYIWEPVDVNRHMTVQTRAGSWVPFFNWRSAYEKDPRPENRYMEYHRRDGTTATLEGYTLRFFEAWPMPGLDLVDVEALTPAELDVMVKQHMRGLLKKKTLGEIREAL